MPNDMSFIFIVQSSPGADIAARDSGGRTPLLFAPANNQYVRALLEFGGVCGPRAIASGGAAGTAPA
jgi:ankyrin repeat protein